VVIHDVARKNSVVHTDYTDIADAAIEDLIFTHNPDNLTAWRPILTSGKRLVLQNGKPYEAVKGSLYPFDADVYIHHFACNMVGYRSRRGAYQVIEQKGFLGVMETQKSRSGLMRVDLYEDIGGEYFPVLQDPKKFYTVRTDGKVEEVTLNKESSSGVVVESSRRSLKRAAPRRRKPSTIR